VSSSVKHVVASQTPENGAQSEAFPVDGEEPVKTRERDDVEVKGWELT
jgi:hypothetical protein